MAIVDLATLTAPISDDDPCGPDLELTGDSDYLNFLARAEGLLPASFFQAEKPRITLSEEFAEAKPILAKTRDVRLLTLLAKLAILSRDLDTFVVCLGGLHGLLGERWDDVHPRSEDGDFGIRMAAIETLDDLTPVILPLQYQPLATHRRYGSISLRSYMIATGEAQARQGEEALDLTTVEKSLMEVELPELVESRTQFTALRAAVAGIQKICLERVGAGAAAGLQRLPALIAKTAALLEDVISKRDPSLALASAEAVPGDGTQNGEAGAAGETGAVGIPAGAMTSPADVADALAAVADYFGQKEPSNPALLLVRQAEQLMGKSFLDVMRILVPSHVDKAVIAIGRDQVFDLPVERLSSFAAIPPRADAVQATEGAAVRRFSANSRGEVIRLLDQIGTFYRTAEPSSPVPFFTERARSLMERDFLSLLKDILPKAALKSIGA